jgi:hypothetical protein
MNGLYVAFAYPSNSPIAGGNKEKKIINTNSGSFVALLQANSIYLNHIY